MEFLSKSIISGILEKYKIAPLKRMGQNFLIDKNMIQKMIDLISPGDIIVEVGPGLGSLTLLAAKKAKKVIAIEKDAKIASAFEKEFLASVDNIMVVKKDILDSSEEFPKENYTVLANLPFYITSPVIRMFLESDQPPKKMILMMQKEVAKRICSKPPNMSILAISVQFYANPKIVFNVSRNSFWPSPNVDCSVILIEKKAPLPKINPQRFFIVVKAGFSHPRAQLLNNFSKELKLKKDKAREWMTAASIDPKRRAESLNIEEWIKLTKEL